MTLSPIPAATTTKEIIDLELSQELQDLGIVTDFCFEADTTQNFILDLNTMYKDVRVIFHYYKDWNRTKRKAKEAIIEKEVHKPHIKPILDTLDANYNNVTATQENYNQDTIDDDDDQEHGQNESSKGENKKSSMEQSFKFVENHIQLLFKNQFGQLFAYVKINDNNYDLISLTSGKFEKYIYKIFYESEYKIILSKEDRNEIIEHLQYKAEFSGITKKLELRVSKTDDYTFYYDLANKNEGIGAVKITPTGWSIENNPPILFIRYSNQLAQVNPSPSCLSTTVDSIDDKIFDKFIALLNVKDDGNKLLLKCYIISLFIPSIPKPILMLHGEQGSAKTTLQELIKMLVDPSIVRTLTFPRDINELVQQLSHNYLAYYENLSSIKEWISDALCRAVTGTGFSKRQLYTDDEDIIYFFLRCIGFNGINLAATKADLLDRGIIIQLERIPKKEKMKLPDIWNKFEILLPSLLSYIFDVLVKVLQIKQKGGITFPNGLNRMADWEEYAEIISRCMGKPEGEFQRVYQENIGLQIDEAIAASPLSLAVVELMNSVKDDDLWSGTATELSEVLNDIAETKLKISTQNIKSWPKSPNYLSRRLNEVKTNLREKGIIIERYKDEKDNRLIKICKVSSIQSYRLENENQAQNDSKTLDDIFDDTKSIPSENKKENQAQKTDIRRYDDTDDTLHASVVELSRVSFNTQDLRHQKQTTTTAVIEESKTMSLREKIEAELFTNPLISESDLLADQDYDYDPEIINNIGRFEWSDRWFCNNCTMKGDKWFMMKHPCNNHKKRKGG